MCRTEHALDAELRQKLSMFCSVAPEAVIEVRDVTHTIYEAPLMFHAEGLDALVCKLLGLQTPEPDLANWRKFVERVISPKKQVTIAVVGKYIDLQDAYKSIYESLTHAAASEDCGINLKLVDAETLQEGVDGKLKDVAGVLSERTRFPTSAFVWACKSRRSNSRAMSADSRAPTARSSIRRQRSR